MVGFLTELLLYRLLLAFVVFLIGVQYIFAFGGGWFFSRVAWLEFLRGAELTGNGPDKSA